MVLPIVYYPNPFLRKKVKTVTEFDDVLKTNVTNMIDTMVALNGVGLAAPQVGIDLKIFVTHENPALGESDIKVFVNPSISFVGKGTDIDSEGCLSIPELFALVRRHRNVLVKACNIEGNPFELLADDFLARIIQHEYDHLIGVLFTDKVLAKEKKEVEEHLSLMRKNNA